MGGFLPDFSRKKQAADGITKKKGMSIYHRHLTEYADGRREGKEQSFEFTSDIIVEGGEWFNNPDKPVLDSVDQHSRTDSKSAVYREKSFYEDEDGNRVSDEFGVRMNDYDTSHGTRMIDNKPESNFDPRISMLEAFDAEVLQIPEEMKKKKEGDKNEIGMDDMRPLPGQWSVQS